MTQLEELTPDLARLRIGFVNVYFAGQPGAAWTLIDGGLSAGAPTIQAVAASRFGGRPPEAVVLTHGHFDHVGALPALLKRWKVPVYAHPLELPFVTGVLDYPPPDPSVGSGLIARMSPLFPRVGTDLGRHVRVLPESDEVPSMPGWKWLHTPGHAPGHVSLFRESNRVLIAGDAVTTTSQESVFSRTIQPEELNGPPEYFTTDWNTAGGSVARLAALRPALLGAGHGKPMRGAVAADALEQLAREFDWRVRPREGRQASHPAGPPAVIDETALVAAPSRRGGPSQYALFYGAAAGAAAAVAWMLVRRGRPTR